ncbi:DNA/RNA helicase domain-containing protein [Plantactinospora endophytica]|uniref:ATP-binding protein n=1 Tax=Plantactinospora endophytica TaxID=673535 RepID=A0ABQ4DUG4_9ACTN|nr:DNA/RNA helicase domain-containing protein [Plantactinospora endophytica]GIG86098.1 ATP-binding protein [Plantactinospora endophytica]
MRQARYVAPIAEFIGATRPQTIERLVRNLRGSALPDRWDSKGESGSWARSLPALADLLEAAGLQRSWIAVEYNPFQAGSGRADAVVMGIGSDGRLTYLVVELKQWQAAAWDAVHERVTGTGSRYEGTGGLRHPYRQARDYAWFVRNFTEGMHDEAGVRIEAAAYLHNANAGPISTLRTAGDEEGRGTFSGDGEGRNRFLQLLQKLFDASGDGRDAKDRLLEARYAQGPAVLEAAAQIFSDRSQYPLTDEQHGVFATIQNAVSDALNVTADRSHAVIVVKGGPGTGKTWIALHLLGANAHAGRQISYATNSSSLVQALKRSTNFRKTFGVGQANKLITSARTYWDKTRWVQPLDLLVVDEAHRLERYTVREVHNNRPEVQRHLEVNNITQLFELKKSARVLVLFIDEDQASTYRDFATIEHAREIANRTGASFEVLELQEQHRSGGSQTYEAWVDALLDGTPTAWQDEEAFTVQVANSPEDLEELVLGDPSARSARLMAGFCWKWLPWPKSPKAIAEIPHDIEINGWRKRWNLRNSIDNFPKDSAWAHNSNGADQVGSVFTAQGFEFDRCGVIIGPDLVWSDPVQRLTVQIEASHYKKLVQLCRQDPTEEVRIRNQYRVLLTRAMSSVVLYSTDPATQALLKRIVNPAQPAT